MNRQTQQHRPRSLALTVSLAVLATMASSLSARAQLEAQPRNYEEEERAKEEEAKKPPVLTKPPALLSVVDAIYPESAMAEGLQGTVVMLITIGTDGLVSDVVIRESAGDALDIAAMEAAWQFTFSPAEFNGVPGAVTIEYRTDFAFAVVEEEVPVVDDRDLGEEFTDLAVDDAEDTGPVNFVGVVRRSGTNGPVAGVEVFIEVPLVRNDAASDDAAAASADTIANADVEYDARFIALTDDKGRFYFRGVPDGDFRVEYAANGFTPAYTEESFSKSTRTSVVVYLEPEDSSGFETVIRAKRAEKETSKITLSRTEVKKIPGTFGDPIRVLENLPGMARAPFLGGQLIVRGANPADTGVYFDTVPIPILYHFGGLKSVVNAEFLEDIQFSPGGFGARYGRATAGIADVSSRSLQMERAHGAADISVIDSSFFVGAPLKLHSSLPTITVAAAGRRSYLDALLPFALEATVGDSIVVTPVYWDYQLKAEVRPFTGQTLSAFVFGSSDDLKVLGGGDDGLQLGVLNRFHRVVGRWTSVIPGGFTHTFQPFFGLNETQIGLAAGDLDAGGTILTYNWGLRDELRWAPMNEIEMLVGIDYLAQSYGFDFEFPVLSASEVGGFPRAYRRQAPNDGETTTSSQAGTLQSVGGYVEAVIRPVPFVQIVPGLRLDMYQAVFTDPDDDITVEKPLLDPLSDSYFWNADPRLAARVDVFKGLTVKGAAGVYRQPPTTQQLSPSSNPNLDQPRAVQLIGGLETNLTTDVVIDVQAYYTNRDLLVQSTGFTGGGPPSDDAFDEEATSNNGGVGNTIGAEFLLRHTMSKYSLRFLDDAYKEFFPGLHPKFMSRILSEVGLFGWVAYTLSRTVVDTNAKSDLVKLSSFDQTHILTIVGQVALPYDFSVGARFRLVSGNPTVLPIGAVQDLDTNNYSPIPSPVESRLKPFNQLDIRIDKRFVFNNFSITPYLDLLNATNNQNAETTITDYRSVEQQVIPGLPILPNFGIQGEF